MVHNAPNYHINGVDFFKKEYYPYDIKKEKEKLRVERQIKNIRTSVILVEEQYGKLNAVAAQNDVSIAWVIRHAINKFLEDYSDQTELPLLIGKEKTKSA